MAQISNSSCASENSHAAPNRSLFVWIQAAAFLLAGGFAFWPAFHGHWLWDDSVEITKNRLLRDAAGLVKLWFAPPGPDYFPLKSTVQWICWHLWADNVVGYHLVNFGTHVLGALLFWRLLSKLGLRWGWLGGLLFAVHPMAVESVAWISELKNTLSLPPLLLAMGAYIDFDRDPAKGRRHYVGALSWFLAAMLCKSSVVMLPAVLLLYAWWRRGRIDRSDLKASAPFFALSVGLGLVTVWFQLHRAPGTLDIPAAGVLSRLGSAGLAIVFYLSKFAFPAGLIPVYPRLPDDRRWLLDFLPGCLCIGLLGWLWIKRAPWRRHILFGFGCFLINLAPVLGFVPMSYLRIAGVADHFAYLPMLGLVGLATAAFQALNKREPLLKTAPGHLFRPAVCWAGVGLIVTILAFASNRYTKIFRDDETCWTYTLTQNPQSWTAANNLATELAGIPGRLPEALAHYEQALRIKPDYAEAHNNLANALAEIPGRMPEALAHYEAALRIKPDYAKAHNNLANALAGIPGRLPEALAHYEEALRIKPDLAAAHYNLAHVLRRIPGRMPEALAHYEEALRIEPDYAEAHNDLANALAGIPGRLPEAVAHYEEALRIKPDLAEAHYNLAHALAEIPGRLPEALAQYEEALRIMPDDAEAQNNVAAIYVKTGRFDEAIAHLELALKLDPALTEARENLKKLRAMRR